MAVNLTKPFRGREYTPVHLMDEEESIQRSSLTTTAAPDKLPSYTPEHIAYEPDAPDQGADIDVSVVHAENAPAVVEKPDLNVYMNELLEGIENADADTREKFMNEFLKAAKKKKKSMKKHETALSEETVHICLTGLAFAVFVLIGFFFPTIIESISSILNESETEAISESISVLLELANHIRPLVISIGFLGMLVSSFRVIHKILFPF